MGVDELDGSPGVVDRRLDLATMPDDALAALLAEEFPEEPLLIEHRVWAVITRKPGKHSP